MEAEQIELPQEVEIEKYETDPLGEFLEQRSRKTQNPKMSNIEVLVSKAKNIKLLGSKINLY